MINMGRLFGLVIALTSLILSYGSLLFNETGAEQLGMIFAICAGLVSRLYFFAGRNLPLSPCKGIHRGLRCDRCVPSILLCRVSDSLHCQLPTSDLMRSTEDVVEHAVDLGPHFIRPSRSKLFVVDAVPCAYNFFASPAGDSHINRRTREGDDKDEPNHV